MSSAQAAAATWRKRGVAAGSRGRRKLATPAATSVSSSRASDAGPRFPWKVDRTRDGLNTWTSPPPWLYGLWSSSPSSVAANRPKELAMTSRPAPGRLPPSGQQMIRNATAPPSSAKHRYASPRTTVYRPLTSGSDAGRTAPTWVALAAPTENVNAPLTGWVSAEMTCQTAVYVPSPRLGRRLTAISSPEMCLVGPTSTRWPLGEYTVRLSALIPTVSSKVALTCRGAVLNTLPSTGSVDASAACATTAVTARPVVAAVA